MQSLSEVKFDQSENSDIQPFYLIKEVSRKRPIMHDDDDHEYFPKVQVIEEEFSDDELRKWSLPSRDIIDLVEESIAAYQKQVAECDKNGHVIRYMCDGGLYTVQTIKKCARCQAERDLSRERMKHYGCTCCGKEENICNECHELSVLKK